MATARESYENAWTTCQNQPGQISLELQTGIGLNYSVFLHDVCKEKEMALNTAKEVSNLRIYHYLI